MRWSRLKPSNWFKPVNEAAQAARSEVRALARSAPSIAHAAITAAGRRIYHEYEVIEDHASGQVTWWARVYGHPSGPIGVSGQEAVNKESAKRQALEWAQRTKKELEGMLS